jgi:site-specific DNA-methyltransferase (adenine-specific)
VSAADASLASVLSGAARWCVVHGDCRDVLAELSDGSVDHVITDPPYSAHTHGNMRGNRGADGIVGRDCGFKHLSAATRRAIAHHACRIATGWIATFSDWESISWWRISINAAGGSYRRAIPWVRWSSPQFNGQAPPSGSEAVIIAKPISRARRWLNGSRTHYDNKCLRWHNKLGHETEKPEGLMEAILLDCTAPGDLVCDPFCGSSTTGAACLRLGRRYIGIEQQSRYVDLSIDRLRAVEQGVPLRAMSAPRRPARAGQAALFANLGDGARCRP